MEECPNELTHYILQQLLLAENGDEPSRKIHNDEYFFSLGQVILFLNAILLPTFFWTQKACI